jgi:hypothetical protein
MGAGRGDDEAIGRVAMEAVGQRVEREHDIQAANGTGNSSRFLACSIWASHQGRYHLARGTPTALAQARSYLQHAIERDPGFALPFDALAELCCRSSMPCGPTRAIDNGCSVCACRALDDVLGREAPPAAARRGAGGRT